MARQTGKTGIFGGTFNPIHNGHLIVAESVREQFDLDKVLFMPSGQPPHKRDSEVIDPERRFEMVKLAVESNPGFEASRVEIDRAGFTYTVNTLQQLHAEYGANTSIYFIIGADVVPELVTWKDFRQVFELCEFIAVLRPGFDKAAFDKETSRISGDFGAVIHTVDARLIDISSTEIRERCSGGESIRYLVPDGVREYIYKEGLYLKTK
ncbi:MAG TPA: nicotinate-nucleotide adenylyltransferase [Clostridia bacterium]|nr:nicotinate-nucleotide adenylyltransferase [Clostridia bacterium]